MKKKKKKCAEPGWATAQLSLRLGWALGARARGEQAHGRWALGHWARKASGSAGHARQADAGQGHGRGVWQAGSRCRRAAGRHAGRGRCAGHGRLGGLGVD